MYVTRTGRYEVDREGRVWLIGGSELPDWQDRKQVKGLPADAVMTNAAMGAGGGGGTTPPGKAGDSELPFNDAEEDKD
jgi:hypothetical protein